MDLATLINTGKRVGAARYIRAGEIYIGRYGDGSLALVIGDAGEVLAKATVAIDGLPAAWGYVWLKGWGENEELPEALVAAGLVELTGAEFPTGYEHAIHARLLPDLLKHCVGPVAGSD